MANAEEVLRMLRPNGGWILVGENYEGINFLECEPITKEEFAAGFAKYDFWKAKQDELAASKKAEAEAKLAALGLSVADLKVLGLA